MGLPVLALLDDLGPAILAADYLENSAFDLQECSSFADLWYAARRTPGSVALVDCRRIGGLLDPAQQRPLAQLDRATPLVLLFDDTVGQPQYAADLRVSAVLHSPILRADLLAVLVRLSRKAAADS
jgi:hypothetical protein